MKNLLMDRRALARWVAALLVVLANTTPAAELARSVTPGQQGMAGPSLPMTLELGQAVEMAAKWHPSIRNAAGYLMESDEAIQVARAGYYPQLRAGLGSDWRNRALSGYDSRSVHQLTVSASQMLYDFGKVSSDVDRAQADREGSQARVLLAIDQLVQETAHAWIEVSRYEALLELAKAQRSGVGSIADLARERRAKGASPLSDELQAQAREEAAFANLLDVTAQLERWRLQLRQLTGAPRLPVTEGLADTQLAGACDIVGGDAGSQSVPAVLIAQAQLRAAQADVENARAQSRPTLSVDGAVSRGLNADSRINRPYDASISLNVTAPLYQGGGNAARRRASGHSLSAAEAALEHVRLQANQELTDARSRAKGYAGRRSVLDERTGSIEHTRDLYRQQYLDMGTRSLLDLLNAEQEFHGARVESVNNMLDLQRMQVDCLAAGGGLRRAFRLDGHTLAGVELTP